MTREAMSEVPKIATTSFRGISKRSKAIVK